MSKPPGLGEFVTLMALMMSLVAVSIDAMLPALGVIGRDLGAVRVNDPQWVITALFLGLASAQMFFGPLSDSIGRKPTVFAGLALFAVGCLLSALATDFTAMLAGRFLQGVGVAAPRIVSLAIVRDLYAGRGMARIMSLVMGVFIMVPVFAPALGQGIMLFAGWRMIFGFLLALAVMVLVWFGLRLPETLPAESRKPFALGRIAAAVAETCANRASLGYTVVAGLVLGALLGYLVSAPQMLAGQYGLGRMFPVYFGVLALFIGAASLVNARLVVRLGMRRLAGVSLAAQSLSSLLFLAVAYGFDGHPPLTALMIYMMVVFACFGTLFGNLNALAMEPLGHIAGVGAAVVGTLTSLLGLSLGAGIGQLYDASVMPVIAGFALLGVLALLVMGWTGRPPRQP